MLGELSTTEPHLQTLKTRNTNMLSVVGGVDSHISTDALDMDL